MSVIDILRKLGIIRFGVKKSVYTSAKDMPAEFLIPGIFNAEKELLTSQDIKEALGAIAGTRPARADKCVACGAELKPEAAFCVGCGAPCVQTTAVKRACPACGAGLMAEAEFCVGCGARLLGRDSSGLLARSRRYVPAMLIVLGVVGVCVVLAILKSPGDQTGATPKRSAPPAIAATPAAKADRPTPAPPAKKIPTVAPPEAADPVVETQRVEADAAVASPMKDWNPESTAEAVAGPPELKYARYENPKFGFIAELPAHWESQVKDNTQLYCGAKGTEEYDTTVTFQMITRTAGSTVKSKSNEIRAQWQCMDGFVLDKIDQGNMKGKPALYMAASYDAKGGEKFRQFQAIIERPPYYYLIGYTAPKPLFRKYYFVINHLISTFKFTEIQK